jgi:hypothetical protein
VTSRQPGIEEINGEFPGAEMFTRNGMCDAKLTGTIVMAAPPARVSRYAATSPGRVPMTADDHRGTPREPGRPGRQHRSGARSTGPRPACRPAHPVTARWPAQCWLAVVLARVLNRRARTVGRGAGCARRGARWPEQAAWPA